MQPSDKEAPKEASGPQESSEVEVVLTRASFHGATSDGTTLRNLRPRHHNTTNAHPQSTNTTASKKRSNAIILLIPSFPHNTLLVLNSLLRPYLHFYVPRASRSTSLTSNQYISSTIALRSYPTAVEFTTVGHPYWRSTSTLFSRPRSSTRHKRDCSQLHPASRQLGATVKGGSNILFTPTHFQPSTNT